jgi:hypothetical protein
MAQPVYLSTPQLTAFTSVLAAEQGGNSRGGNNRMVQPLNGRQIRASFQGANPVVVAGALQLQTTLNSAQFQAQEAAFITGLAAHLGVAASDIDITSYKDVASRRRSLLQANTDGACACGKRRHACSSGG